MTHAAVAHRYATDVVSGKIDACKFVIQACQRHLDDLVRAETAWPYTFDEAAAEKVCRFAELMPHTKGIWASKSQRIQLQPWQAFILASIFGWKRKRDGLRRYREAYIEVPRKNGKSQIAAIVGLYMLSADGEAGAEVYCGATSEKQAWEVFRPAKFMADKVEAFRQHYGVTVHASNIAVPGKASRFEPLIGKPGDGASPHCAILDEFHEHQTPDQYDTMLTGMGARSQPLQFAITTAGTNLAGPCYDRRGSALKVLDGVFEDDALFVLVYTCDEGDDWTDIKVWRKANPNFGISVDEDFLIARQVEAKQRASRQNIILCKHLNLWLNAKTAWMNMIKWAAAERPEMKAADLEGERCVVGLDLAARIDIAARMTCFRKDDEKGRPNYYAFLHCYMPEELLSEPQSSHYAGWEKEGHITATEGNEIDFGTIEEDLTGYHDSAGNPVGGHIAETGASEIVFDPWQGAYIGQRLAGAGATVVEMRNTVQNFSPAMKEIEAAVLSGRFHHDGNPVFTWMMSNVVAKLDKKDNIFPNKERPEAKIDGVVALIMCVARLMNADQAERPLQASDILITAG